MVVLAITYGNGIMDSDSVDLGSNPGSPASHSLGLPPLPEGGQDGHLRTDGAQRTHKSRHSVPLILGSPWLLSHKADPRAVALADRHYSRRKVGSPQFMPLGQTLVLITADEDAVFGWWRPHPRSGLKAMNGLYGWMCTIFRNEGAERSSSLILMAETELLERHDCGPDGMLTYVWDSRIRSANPGYCFKCAGWSAIGRSADKRKTLLQKRPHRQHPIC